MKFIPEEEWTVFPTQLAADVKKRLSPEERVQFTVDDLLDTSGSTSQEIRALLDRLVTRGYLEAIQSLRCPRCSAELDAKAIHDRKCSACELEFEDGALPAEVRVYIREGPTSRDVLWAVAIHGMNTPGDWQQDVSWRLAQMYGYSIPFGIYKYGNIKLSPLIPHRQRHHRDLLIEYMKKVRQEMAKQGKGERPDVIAHSFGTWLISEALKSDTGADRLKVGRIILAGSIVRPDFDWKKLIEEDVVEAVLCHCALRDKPVRMAQFTIQGSGPSGTNGFNDRAGILHWDEPRFDHSDYFLESNLHHVMEEVWKPFLQRSAANSDNPPTDARAKSPWKPSPFRFITHPLMWALLIFLLWVVYRAIHALVLGFMEIGLF